jgi:hypothetical protein
MHCANTAPEHCANAALDVGTNLIAPSFAVSLLGVGDHNACKQQ